MSADPKTLLFVVGPQAVGKMAVGHEVAIRTGLRLFHNHKTIEPFLGVFDYGTPQFGRLCREFRIRVIEEVVGSELPGVIFTFVWAFDLPSEAEEIELYARPFRDIGARVLFVELEAELEERLRRNTTEFRLREKASKRDVESSRIRMLDAETRYRMNTGGEFDAREDWLRIENTNLPASEAAERIIDHFGLARVDAG